MIGSRRRCMALLIALVFGSVEAAPAIAADDDDLVRVVVQLEDPPLAKYRDTLAGIQGVAEARTADGHLDVRDAASREYLTHVADEQGAFERQLDRAAPAADVHWRYKVAFNGMTIELPRGQLDAVRQLPGVVAVTEAYDLEPELDESPALLGLPQLWQSLPPNPLGAGAGSRLALIDNGVNPAHPFFDPAGYTAPPGYPKAQRVAGGVRTNLPLGDLREQQGDRRQRLHASRRHDHDAVGPGVGSRHPRRRDHGRRRGHLPVHVRAGHVPAAPLGDRARRADHELPALGQLAGVPRRDRGRRRRPGGRPEHQPRSQLVADDRSRPRPAAQGAGRRGRRRRRRRRFGRECRCERRLER